MLHMGLRGKKMGWIAKRIIHKRKEDAMELGNENKKRENRRWD